MKRILTYLSLTVASLFFVGCQVVVNEAPAASSESEDNNPEVVVDDPTEEVVVDDPADIVTDSDINITLKLEEAAGVSQNSASVRSGIPFPKGRLTADQHLGLFANNSQLPLDYRPISLWDDGSVRWMLFDARVDLTANDTKTLTIKEVAEPASDTGVSITSTTEFFTVDTGSLRVEIPRLHGGVISRIWQDDQLVMDYPENITDRGPYIKVFDVLDGSNTAYFGGLLTGSSMPLSNDPMKIYQDLVLDSGHSDYNTYDPFELQVSVEESSALQATIRISGAHLNASNEAFSSFILRLHFYKNKSSIDIGHTLVYTGEETQQVAGYGFNLPFTGNSTYIDGESNSTGELLHNEYRNYSINDANRSGQAKGYISRQNANHTVSVVLRDMAEKFPKALVADGSGLDVQLYPDSVVDWDLSKYSPDPSDSDFQNEDPSASDYSLLAAEIATRRGETRRRYFERGAQGFSVSDNYAIYVDSGSFSQTEMDDRSAIMDAGPLRLVAPASWYSDAAVMGVGPFAFEHDLSGSEGHYRIDRILQVVEDFMRINQRKQFDWFGLEDYGDIRGLFYGSESSSKTWSTKGRYGWSGNSGETSNQIWVQYLRKPSQQLFRDAEALARHTLDQQTVHFADLDCGDDEDCTAAGYALIGRNRFRTVGSIHRHGVQAWSGYANSPDYSHNGGVETYYYLTGDARAKEVLYEQAHFIMRQYSAKTGIKNGLDVLDRAIAVHYEDEATVAQFEERAQDFIDYMAADQGAGWNGVESRLIDYDLDGQHDRDSEGKSNRSLYQQGFEFFMRGAPGLLYRHERLQEDSVGQLILDAANILTLNNGDDWELGLDGHAGSYMYHLNTLTYAAHIANSMGVSKTPYYDLAKRSVEFNTHGGTDTNETRPFSLSALQAIPADWNDWQWTWDEDDEVAVGEPGILWLARQITYNNNYLQDYHSYRAFIHLATGAAMVEQGQMQLR